MQRDAYGPCVCGSGKKFKWCCAPIYDQVDRAHLQLVNKQFDAAKHILEKLAQDHPQNPAAWCYLAEVLLEEGKPDTAQQAVEKALALDANQPKALFLQGVLHQAKDDISTALTWFRRAADYCDASVAHMMAEIHFSIASCESMLNRPVASKAAMDIARRFDPTNATIQERYEQLFGSGSELPEVVRANHAFKKMMNKDALPADVLRATQGGKLGKLHQLMEDLTQQLSYDASFFYNLGLTRAWVGQNQAAVDAFDQYVRQAADDQQGAEAWCLAETLRLGMPNLEDCDYQVHFAAFEIANIDAFSEFLRTDRRIVGAERSDSLMSFWRLDRDLPQVQENLATFDLPRVQARMLAAPTEMLAYTHDAEQLQALRQEVENRWGQGMPLARTFSQPASFGTMYEQVLSFRLPSGLAPELANRLTTEMIRSFFEEQWARRPLRSLQGNTPLDAVGHPVLRRKVLGMILLWEQILAMRSIALPYTMDDLRRKLGLLDAAAPSEIPHSASAIRQMSAAELAALDAKSLSDGELRDAFSSARGLDANDLAMRFAQEVVQRPESADTADRFLYDQFVIFQLLGEQRVERAYAATIKAMERDAKSNAGKRSLDYRKLRVKVLLAGKRLAEAQIDLDKLLAEFPGDLDLHVFVVEELLRFNHKEFAAKYAGMGKSLAEQKGDRDRAGFFSEVVNRFAKQA